jgi:hypothetical protein
MECAAKESAGNTEGSRKEEVRRKKQEEGRMTNNE